MAAKRASHRLLIALPVLALAGLVLLAWRAGTPRAASTPQDIDAPTREEREQVRRIITENSNAYPIWRDLWEGRVGPGHPVEDLIAATRPAWVTRFGRFVTVEYGPPGGEGNTLGVTARDGRLVAAHAGDCTWNHTFFDAMDRPAWDEFAAARRRAAGE